MATTLYHNGEFWPGVATGTIFSAMLVEDEKIIVIGDHALQAEHDLAVDLKGAFVSPAFADGHAHPLFGGRQSFGPQITGLETVSEIVSEVARFAAANPDLEWIIGGTYDPAIMQDGNFDATWLDEVVANRPVVLNAMDYHTIWVNSEAMRRCGINSQSEDLAIGTIVRRADSTPMGTLREWDAVNLVMDKVPLPSMDSEIAALPYSSKPYALHGIPWGNSA